MLSNNNNRDRETLRLLATKFGAISPTLVGCNGKWKETSRYKELRNYKEVLIR